MVIPLHDSNPTRRRAVVTLAIIALNVVVFLLEPVRTSAVAGGEARAACTTQAFLSRWAAIPSELTTNQQSDRVYLGPVDAGCVIGPPNYTKQPVLSVLTAMF